MRTVVRHGVGGIFGRSSSVGAHVQGAVTRYSADQRALPVLAGLGADWAPGQPTPDMPTILAHGYYRGEDLHNPADKLQQVAKLCPQMPYQWDCNMPNLKLVSTYAAAASAQTGGMMDRFVGLVRNGTLPPPPGFPSLTKEATLTTPLPAPPRMMQAPAPSSNMGLFIGLGVAVLALGGAVVVKKKRAA